MSVLFETTIGDFVVDLNTNDRPRTSQNFLKLCKLKFYNFSRFHSVETNFIAQCGKPALTKPGDAIDGESVFRYMYGEQARYFEAETNPPLKHLTRGTISMVNNGENMHGSQFFLTLSENLDYLDGKHTVFGEVSEGIDIIDALNNVLSDEFHVPYQDVRVCHTIVLYDPFPEPDDLDYPTRSPSPSLALLQTMRLAPTETLNDETLDPLKSQEIIEAKEAKARAHVLEMIGDIHHADEKPPDNVLFVCKLNPVTLEDDLIVIFSRFGAIKDVEIIRDRVSGKSLQYGFVEFEKPENCEAAYFKMDNVLIDDRRIHVDFSQSVAKNYTWKKNEKVDPQKDRSKEPQTSSRSKLDQQTHNSANRDNRRVDHEQSNKSKRSPDRSRRRNSPESSDKYRISNGRPSDHSRDHPKYAHSSSKHSYRPRDIQTSDNRGRIPKTSPYATRDSNEADRRDRQQNSRATDGRHRESYRGKERHDRYERGYSSEKRARQKSPESPPNKRRAAVSPEPTSRNSESITAPARKSDPKQYAKRGSISSESDDNSAPPRKKEKKKHKTSHKHSKKRVKESKPIKKHKKSRKRQSSGSTTNSESSN